MNKILAPVAVTPIAVLLFFLAIVTPCLADTTIIIGEVNDDCQLVESTSGQIYEVARNNVGDDMVNNYISQKVKATGQISEKNGTKVILVIHFEVIPD